jgi:two-component system, cell cycle response regulator
MSNDANMPTILLVDDDPHFLRTVGDFLAFEGFKVITSNSGESALDVLERVRPDLIILDIAMPGMGGVGFLRRILAANGTPRHPVLVLTARAAMKEFFDAVEVHGFLPKPCRQDDLLRHVQRILARAGRKPPRGDGERPQATVLLGESNRHLVAALTKALQEAGYSVEVAETGPAVLEKAVAIRPHAILIQNMLPRLNGEAVCGLLREIPSTSRIPIILYRDGAAGGTPPGAFATLPEVVERYVFSQDVLGLIAAVQDVIGLPAAAGGAAQPPPAPA